MTSNRKVSLPTVRIAQASPKRSATIPEGSAPTAYPQIPPEMLYKAVIPEIQAVPRRERARVKKAAFRCPLLVSERASMSLVPPKGNRQRYK